jgi:hypothetical protein
MTSKSIAIKYEDAFANYYKLKQEYEKNEIKEVTKLVGDNLMSATEKKEKFDKFKRKCVNCKKNGGTIFKQQNDILIAQCGSDHPCKLNIQLQRAKYNNITKEITDLAALVNDNKTEIITTKLNFLFGFKDEPTTIATFNQLKLDLISKVKNYQILNEKYMNIIHGAKREEVKKDNLALSLLIQNFKDLIKNFDETSDIKFLKEAMELYIESISKLATTIRTSKYVYNVVQYNISDDTNHLIQETYTPSELQVIIPGTENKIIAYTI